MKNFVFFLSVSRFRFLRKLGDLLLIGIYIFIISNMENITEMSYDNDSSKSIAKERNSRYRSNGRLEFAEERLFSMKAQDIADDLTQIMMFIKELERF